MEEEKLGKIIVDGEIVDLDNLPAEKLEIYVEKLEKRKAELEYKIDSILDR